MDLGEINGYLRLKYTEYSQLGHRNLLESLHFKEYVEIEEKKTILFRKRLDFFVMAKCLRIAMINQTGCKQFKRYLRDHIGWLDEDAEYAARRYNEASRTYDKFDVIVRNLAEFPNIDIRDLSINELPLTVNKEWVRLRSASLQPRGKRKADEVFTDRPQQVDWGKVYETVDGIFKTDWYKDLESDPSLIAHIMNKVSTLVVRQSQYASKRARR